MPYYVYKITSSAAGLIKNLELLAEFDAFKEAKNLAKTKRMEQAEADPGRFKVIFAANPLAAEEMLQEHREAPIVREWEK